MIVKLRAVYSDGNRGQDHELPLRVKTTETLIGKRLRKGKVRVLTPSQLVDVKFRVATWRRFNLADELFQAFNMLRRAMQERADRFGKNRPVAYEIVNE